MAKDKLYQVRVFATVTYENSEIEAEDAKEAFNIAVNEIEEQLKKTDLELDEWDGEVWEIQTH